MRLEWQETKVRLLAFLKWERETGGVRVDQAETDGFYFDALDELGLDHDDHEATIS